MRVEARYSVSRCSLMQDRACSTLATLPLARAKASRVSSASGLTQQLVWAAERRLSGTLVTATCV